MTAGFNNFLKLMPWLINVSGSCSCLSLQLGLSESQGRVADGESKTSDRRRYNAGDPLLN